MPKKLKAEDEVLNELRASISDALKRKDADAAKLLSQAYAEVKAVSHNKVGF